MKPNIFEQHAADRAGQQQTEDALMFMTFANSLHKYGIEKTRQALAMSIDSARSQNDQSAMFFFQFALTEIHS